MQLGKKIRELRFRRGLTVQQLADASSLSKGFISQVENDRTSPSLATLRDLARALDTSVAYLVVEDDPPPFIVRERDCAQVMDAGRAQVQILSAQPRRNLEVLMAMLPAGGSAVTDRGYHHGEECVVCLDGRVCVANGEHRVVLEMGDACHYDGRSPHTVQNVGETPARVMIAITPTSFELHPRAKASATGVAREIEVGNPG